MNRFFKPVLAILVMAVCSVVAHAVWDSTTGNMPNFYPLCWGSNQTACLYGSTSSSNFVRIQTGGVDALTVDSSQRVTVPGNLTVTGLTTFATPVSSFTVANATGTYTQTTLNACVSQSTVSVTLPSGITAINVTYSGASSTTVAGSTVTVGFLIDGAYATMAGVAETASKGVLSVGTISLGSGYDVNTSFGPVRVSGLAAGFHNICMTIASTSGSVTLDSTNAISFFGVSYAP